MPRKTAIFILFTILCLPLLYGLFAKFVETKIHLLIEREGTEITNSEVKIDSFNLAQLSTANIQNFSVLNPDGFSSADIFKIGAFVINLDILSLLSDKVDIEEIKIDQPNILVEFNNQLQSNLWVIRSNVLAKTKLINNAENKTKVSSFNRKKLYIKKLEILNPLVELKYTTSQNTIPIKIQNIKLENLGGNTGKFPEELTNEILEKLNFQITMKSQRYLNDQISKIQSEKKNLEKKFDKLKKNLKLKSQGIESDTKLKLEKELQKLMP